jgi:PhnB protein
MAKRRAKKPARKPAKSSKRKARRAAVVVRPRKKASGPKAIPDGYHSATPYLTLRGAAQAIDFYQRAFGATESMRMPSPDGSRIMHAELRVGDSVIMLSDEFEGGRSRSPQAVGATTGHVFLYVPDVDAAFARAVDAGATAAMPVQDMFWGDRYGRVVDPFGHEWSLATHKEDVSPEEMGRRAATAFSAPPQ